jgi:hypothetical protein
LLFASGSQACDIEDWRFFQASKRYIQIEGTTTCSSGVLYIRVYDGDTRKYVGNAKSYIKGNIFETIMRGVAPASVSIKYTIDAR